MNKSRSHHVLTGLNGGWSVWKDGSRRASRHFQTRQEAVEWGRALSRNQGTDLFIHRPDGTVQEKSSHGHDPLPA